ncbi:uncharacterized protein G6M90_00g111860 [Metarhizium brunneum]|uniref:Uncharacterized protein n=1 Tax=Metarhizium brunneum TaxID=500148 RepID=A0A7D5ZDZ1_9HYPO|nr:hypothetical protein G6M90_00g111860 [Metarhizium brunneum]
MSTSPLCPVCLLRGNKRPACLDDAAETTKLQKEGFARPKGAECRGFGGTDSFMSSQEPQLYS